MKQNLPPIFRFLKFFFIASYKKKLLAIFIAFFTIYSLSAQKAATKLLNTAAVLNNTASNLNSANNAANAATSSVSNTKGTVENAKAMLGSLFGSKKKKKEEVKPDNITTTSVVPPSVPAPVSPASEIRTILINIYNIDYTKLKELEDSVKTIIGVKSTSKKFNSAAPFNGLQVGFAGEADELWDAMPAIFKANYEPKDISDVQITLQLKKK